MNSTVPVFILGSGRSGTLQVVKLLENIEGIQANHEYLFEKILKSAVLYRMGVVGDEEIKKLLMETYVPAVYYANTPIWLDCSNALPWIVKPLHELFPNARFNQKKQKKKKKKKTKKQKNTKKKKNDQCVNIVKNWLDNPD